jgi:hypothetical protein
MGWTYSMKRRVKKAQRIAATAFKEEHQRNQSEQGAGSSIDVHRHAHASAMINE